MARPREGHREVHRHRRLPHPAFARGDGEDARPSRRTACLPIARSAIERPQAFAEPLDLCRVHRHGDDVDRSGNPCRRGSRREASAELLACRVLVGRDSYDGVDAAAPHPHVGEHVGIDQAGEEERVLDRLESRAQHGEIRSTHR